ncbi:hypothetical protein G4G27_02440 [Sphingomonas sp. So64.6b]|uniref:hypothetical protein n=1 Tax=Sphingomonas sp. So64.6b TaxID=2997354 RepID=UPI0016032160|nr:hypothetical protein [Sphingomonas sp. So64.6b]QNA83000.1 hypothetical protein G4G27_02440 [Sphingomonas sp. So64.6b]
MDRFATTSLVGFAPAPVSTRLISGSATVRSYGTSWVGDDSDILLPDSVHSFVDIDMMTWVGAFLCATDALFAPKMAAAIAALDPDRAASLAKRKQQLADVIARTLIPVLLIPGQVPAVEPARALFHQSLLERLGTAYPSEVSDGNPLHLFPPLPVVSSVRAVPARSPMSIAEAILWDCVATVVTPQTAQDELLLSVTINDLSAPSVDLTGKAAVAAAPHRSAAATLFEALARMTFEHRQIVPHLEQVLSGGNAAVARAALERLDALIGDVARTWPDWFARTLPIEAAEVGSASAVDRVTWSYTVDFSRLPVLSVTRLASDNGVLPPWPAIAESVAPPEDGQATNSYQASAGFPAEAPLTFTWVKLPILWAQQVDVAASVRRNANLVTPGLPDGTLVDPAFIYRSPPAHGSASVGPFAGLPLQPFQFGAGAANLSEAMDDLLTTLLAGPTLAGLAIRDVQIEIDASYRISLGAQDEPIDSPVPIFLTRNTLALSPSIADGSIPVTAFRQNVIDALIAWHAAMQPEDTRAAIHFAITLSAAGAKTPTPLVFLGQAGAIVPIAQADWWR